jgi:hypothetical protein
VRLQGIVGANRTNFILAKSLFALVLGSCDIANTYFGPTSRRVQYDLASYADLMVNYASEFLEVSFHLVNFLSNSNDFNFLGLYQKKKKKTFLVMLIIVPKVLLSYILVPITKEKPKFRMTT